MKQSIWSGISRGLQEHIISPPRPAGCEIISWNCFYKGLFPPRCYSGNEETARGRVSAPSPFITGSRADASLSLSMTTTGGCFTVVQYDRERGYFHPFVIPNEVRNPPKGTCPQQAN
ncbi:MAG: hypothetical protein LLG42_15940 [Chloroflexi bacterium]|nr:hypothetical protein [Chloroflexota bacterium]